MANAEFTRRTATFHYNHHLPTYYIPPSETAPSYEAVLTSATIGYDLSCLHFHNDSTDKAPDE